MLHKACFRTTAERKIDYCSAIGYRQHLGRHHLLVFGGQSRPGTDERSWSDYHRSNVASGYSYRYGYLLELFNTALLTMWLWVEVCILHTRR